MIALQGNDPDIFHSPIFGFDACRFFDTIHFGDESPQVLSNDVEMDFNNETVCTKTNRRNLIVHSCA